ncbi:MAG: TIGR03620 family F420-dependent LLM class oxidoreductase [Halieaceae bacterium]|nr:TIGR03620 family F420-dependent LLM class oxidoreductase [Halieaceae bacterium]MCP4842820.1 TIGR03620 family F420-dependent LLM class oxidoreductase [Halieaceae bacterium]
MATKLNKLGVWAFIDEMSAKEAADFASQLEAWGYSALWIPEAVGRDPFSIISYMASATEKLVFATGIANIYARDPMSMNALRRTVGEIAPGRFIMGLGVSHAPLVKDIRGHDYRKPVTTMRKYIEGMDSALYMAEEAPEPPPILLGALRQNMLKLSAEKGSGAHPYFVPPQHTAWARGILGADALLCPEQMLLMEPDPDKARQIARAHMGTYTTLDNYRNNLKQFGFEDEDFENGGSDKLVDAIVAWGEKPALVDRIQAHWSAGADHVCIQALQDESQRGPDIAALEALAPVHNPDLAG